MWHRPPPFSLLPYCPATFNSATELQGPRFLAAEGPDRDLRLGQPVATAATGAEVIDGQVIDHEISILIGRLHGQQASTRGDVLSSSGYSKVWEEARQLGLIPRQAASPLAGRPYDLRHAGVSL